MSILLNISTSLVTPASKGTISVTTADRGSGGLYIQGVADQSADYINIQNASGTTLFDVDSSGNTKVAGKLTVADTVTASKGMQVGMNYPWYGGWSKALSIGGTAGGAGCGTEGCPLITLNDNGANGTRWGIGVNTGGTMSIMTESAGVMTSRLTIGNTNSCTVATGTGATSCTSDARLKSVQGDATGNLAKIMQLNPKYYTWNSDDTQTIRMGLIAQNVQSVLPEFVITGQDGYLQLDYGSLVTPLIGAVQEQQAEIEALGTSVTTADLNVSGTSTLAELTVTGNATVQGSLTVQGDIETRNITVNGHIITGGSAPQVTIQPGAGVADATNNIAAPTVTVEGNDTSGTLTITTGANTSADELAKLTFATAFTGKPRVVLTPANRDSADLGAYYDATTTSSDSFSILATQVPVSGKTYMFTYFVVQ
jgi:cytoskeletal protein CcmA (bactofilin family)